MKRTTLFLLVLLALVLSACGSASKSTGNEAGTGTGLLVSGGDIQKTFMRPDLEKLPVTKASFKGVEYVGITVTEVLKAAGFDPQRVKAVKAVASDGFTVNYDPAQFLAADTLVAYAQANGDLTAEDGSFRMVLPNGEGKVNLRMMVELQVIQ